MSEHRENRKDINVWIKKAQQGEEDALEFIVNMHLPLIRATASRFYFTAGGLAKEDLIQAGIIGLLRALENYDPKNGAALSTYALHWILGEMKYCARKAMDSMGEHSLVIRFKAEEKRLRLQLGRIPTYQEIAKVSGMNEKEAAQLAVFSLISLDDKRNGQTLTNLKGVLSDRDSDRVEIKFAIESLPEKERQLILLRYFRDLTQKDTALLLGMSQTQISRIERRALDHLKEFLI